MTLSRQERRRAGKKKMNRPANDPAAPPGAQRLPVCNPSACNEVCEHRNFGKEGRLPGYDELLEKYVLVSHIEKTDTPRENSTTIEVFSKLFCPPETMDDFRDAVMDQLEQVFDELEIEPEEAGTGDGFFSARARIPAGTGA